MLKGRSWWLTGWGVRGHGLSAREGRMLLGLALALAMCLSTQMSAAAAGAQSQRAALSQAAVPGDPGVVMVNGIVQAPQPSTCVQPPANVDLTALSDAQLAVYGLPSRAEFAQLGQMDQWTQLVRAAREHGCSTVRTGPVLPKHEHSQSVPGAPNTKADEVNDHWGGYENTGGGYQYESTEFIIPTPGGPANTAVALWGGIGGDVSGDALIQDGVQSWSNAYCCELWWTDDNWGDEEQGVKTVYIGDQIYVSADWNYHAAGCAYFYMEDITRGYYNGTTDPRCYNMPQGKTAEFITEANGDSGLESFNPYVTFSGNYTVRNGVGNYVQYNPWQHVWLENGNGQSLIALTALNGSSFEASWLRAS